MSSKAKRRKLDIEQDHENPLMDDDNEFRLLPELLKMILTKAVFVQMYSKDTAKRESDKSIFINLASIDFRWWCSMKKYNFKNKVRHVSKVYLKKTKMRSTIIRNNRKFLKEVIDPDKIIFPLESCGFLTEDQVTFLTRLRNHKEKNHELLFMMQDFSSQKYSKMIDCLFLANQASAALVLEKGGEAVKVHINNEKAMRTREFEMELIERFQRMQTENILILNDLLNASVEKFLNDVHILHAKQNKGIELWFWCKTNTSLNRLKGLSEDDLREIIQRMQQRLIPEHSTSLETQFIQMDYFLGNGVAERRISVRHVGDTGNLIGFDANDAQRLPISKCVTSLADKIYIAQTGKILVYENKYPYHATEPIVDLFGHDSLPVSIASCNINKCLYISFGHIFKVEPEFENRVSIWLKETTLLSSSVSVTSKGDVLVPRRDIEGHMLLIFTTEGTVKRTISLWKVVLVNLFIQEIMPGIVAMIDSSNCISIMRLDDNGTILRRINWPQTIVDLSSFRCGNLVLGVSRYKQTVIKRGNSSDFVSLNLDKYHIDSQLKNFDVCDNFDDNDDDDDDDGDYYDYDYDYERGSVQLHQWPIESNVARDLLTTDEKIYGVHFAADQKQLYVLSNKNLHVYQLKYEDEESCP